MDIKEIFAQRLIKLREQHNISQQTLADAVHITRQSLSLYEKAERTINIDLLVKIADYFNINADYLLGITPYKTVDLELQKLCLYSGLSEEALENIVERFGMYKRRNDTPPIVEGVREMFQKNADLISELLSSDIFWEYILNLIMLKTVTKNPSEGGYTSAFKVVSQEDSEEKISNIFYSANVADLCRYRSTQQIEQINDMFDMRTQKEASDNGKHNPKKE